MSRAPLDSDPGELLRRLAQESLPSSPEDNAPARRERLVRVMKDAVERSAEANETSRRLRLGGAVLAAAAAFALLGGMWWKDHARGAATTIAGLDRVSGTVVLTQEGKGRVVSGGERALHDGDALQTATGAHAHFQTSKSSVNVSESTELRLSRPSAAEERISLRRGRVDVSVEKAVETKRAVVVETPDAEVVVRGTIFDVRVDPLQSSTNTHVHVTRGSVWVLAQGVQVALLSAGQSWSSASGVENAARPTADVPTAAPAPVVSEAPIADTAAPAPAAKFGAVRDAARKGGTLAEENRLFSAGVEARNRGDAPRAAELFGELLSTYPQTTLREVAQVERFRALSRAGQSSRAASEARHYLAEHPDGAAKTEARDLALDSQK
ncbi:MAG TPA: FecR domain-containing protein [Polyangiaceae bacterium]|nr:FecR domain-containing protein [Polyangiaceae bacterium]